MRAATPPERKAAVRSIRDREALTLGALDREVFLEALRNPPAPPKRLRQAAENYKRLAAR